ncbi:MAG: hypothetical protein K6E75_14130 [Lachnospiraceae bacterium]|nr:hypothetical protein [Lachnospiraceae bacterium]
MNNSIRSSRFLAIVLGAVLLILAFSGNAKVLAAEEEGKTIAQLGLSDGIYTMPVTLEGGSIGAAVTSPARVQIKDGTMTALIEWDNAYYTKMTVNGTSFEPEKREGNTKFKIPVTKTDVAIPISYVIDDFGTATQINCTLTFDSSAIEKAQPRVSKGYAYGSAAIFFFGVISLAALALFMIHRRMNKSFVE